MSLRKRLGKVEKTLANMVGPCSCKVVTVAIPNEAEELKAEMDETCPVHGVRRLGQIIRVSFVAPDSCPENEKDSLRQDEAEIGQLLDLYKKRLQVAFEHSCSKESEHEHNP